MVAITLLAACDPYAWSRTAEPRVDTLPGGTVRVRNDGPGIWRGGAEWRLVEEFRFGTDAQVDAYLFGDVADLDVDAAGRIYVLDRPTQEIRVFEADGAYLRTITRFGHGPGELAGATGFAFDQMGNLWVSNQANGRYSIFDTTGALVAELRRPSAMRASLAAWLGVPTTSGTLYDVVFYASARGLEFAFARYDSARAAFVDTLQGVGFPSDAPPLWGVQLGTWTGWWIGSAATYRLFRTDFEGDTTRIVERRYDPVPVVASTGAPGAAMQPRHVQDALGQFERPKHLPIFRAFIEDDAGFLWVVLTETSDTASRSELDVFDPTGRYLGTLSTPRRLAPAPRPIIRGGRVYAVSEYGGYPIVTVLGIRGRRTPQYRAATAAR